MAASLYHAAPLLTAALNAGFRESGIQSLKNLSDPTSFPMLAIRSSGLALESVIGAYEDRDESYEDRNQSFEDQQKSNEDREEDSGREREVDCLVSEEYLEMLVRVANQRFVVNGERTRRFEEEVFRRGEGEGEDGGVRREGWEDRGVRRERMRREGLRRREEKLRREVEGEERNGNKEEDA